MKKNIFLIAAVLGAGAWYLLGKKQLADKTKLLFKKISFGGGLLHPTFLLDFIIQNPTNNTGTISAITGEVLINDKIIADFSSFGVQKISANSESTLRINAKPTIGIISLLTSKGWLKKGVKYKIKGTANFDGIIAPFEYSGSLA